MLPIFGARPQTPHLSAHMVAAAAYALLPGQAHFVLLLPSLTRRALRASLQIVALVEYVVVAHER